MIVNEICRVNIGRCCFFEYWVPGTQHPRLTADAVSRAGRTQDLFFFGILRLKPPVQLFMLVIEVDASAGDESILDIVCPHI